MQLKDKMANVVTKAVHSLLSGKLSKGERKKENDISEDSVDIERKDSRPCSVSEDSVRPRSRQRSKIKRRKSVKETFVNSGRRPHSAIVDEKTRKQFEKEQGTGDDMVDNEAVNNENEAREACQMMFYAIHYNDCDTLENALETTYGKFVDSLNEDGIAAIHFAAMTNAINCIDVLKRHKCDLDLEDIRGQTAIHYAVLMKNFNFAAKLLEVGATSIETKEEEKSRFKRNSRNRRTWYL